MTDFILALLHNQDDKKIKKKDSLNSVCSTSPATHRKQGNQKDTISADVLTRPKN
jgi:hypothetical protein